MEKFLWCQPNDILFPIPTHKIWDTCHLISYKIPIPVIILSYEPKEAWSFPQLCCIQNWQYMGLLYLAHASLMNCYGTSKHLAKNVENQGSSSD